MLSRTSALIPQATFFDFYIIDIFGIFGIEFLNQNIPFSADTYYDIPIPLLRILSGAGVMASLWIMLLENITLTRRQTVSLGKARGGIGHEGTLVPVAHDDGPHLVQRHAPRPRNSCYLRPSLRANESLVEV